MTFNSFAFFVFLPIVVVAFFAIPPSWRWLGLLVASYTFYAAWRIEFCLVILGSTAVDYGVGLLLARTLAPRRRRCLLALSFVVNLGLLVFFKYLAFGLRAAEPLLLALGVIEQPIAFHVLLPLGISFYTFQTLSYTIDVYRNQREPERHFGIFAVYVSFFPQLLAGPIERTSRLLPQFRQVQRWDYARTREGVVLILLGLFEKTRHCRPICPLHRRHFL